MAETIEDMIRALQALPKAVEDSAQEVGKALKTTLDEQIAKGVGPDGEAWKARKAGGQPLQNAAAAVTVTVSGAAIVVSLESPEARHHYGLAKGGIKRQVLPTAQLPAAMISSMQIALAKGISAKWP